jgi:hypothetical protein
MVGTRSLTISELGTSPTNFAGQIAWLWPASPWHGYHPARPHPALPTARQVGAPYHRPLRRLLFTLIRRETTLMGGINSLLGFWKLPVFPLGNSAGKSLI